MIGTAGQKNIVLAYCIPTFDELTTEQKATLTFCKTEVSAFAKSARTLVQNLKNQDRSAKSALEETKNKKRDALGDKAFHDYLFQKGNASDPGYIEALRTIGMTSNRLLQELSKSGGPVDTLRTALKQKNLQTPVKHQGTNYFKFEVNAAESGVKMIAKGDSKRGVQDSPVATLVEVITDPAKAYDKIAVTNAQRDVFQKKQFPGLYEHPTQYVQDDDGIFTRRYAVMHKRRSALKNLLEFGYLKGRFAYNGATPTGMNETAALALDPNVYKVQSFEAKQVPDFKAGDTLNTRQMLHVHQELGSGDSARGMCLTSCSISQDQLQGSAWKANLKTMYANPGPAFGNDDTTVLVLVDLAKVPTGKELLYNLYRPDAQEKAQAVKLSTGSGVFPGNAHMLDSVSKNREVFLRVLVPSFVVNYEEVKQETLAGDWQKV